MNDAANVLWEPPADALSRSQIGRYLGWLADARDIHLRNYDELWHWSVSDLERFWASLWAFFEIRASTPYQEVLSSREMPGARWFSGARLNYAEHAVGRADDADRLAVLAHSQTRAPVELTFGELREQVARARVGLERIGVRPGDRVVAYMPNIPETLVAFLATASLGAIWATCAPEFGPRSVVSRFGVVEPKVLLAVAGYRYGKRLIDKRADVASIRAALPTVEHVVHVPYLGAEKDTLPDATSWEELLNESGPLTFEPLSFDHPLFVLFSSGTTGLPKAIVHRHGGILIEHHKNHGLSWDLQPGDRLMWFSTTAWMMWNALISALLLRSSIVMIDGNPLYPDIELQWRLAEQTRATMMGASPAFLMG
ncbi:MAG: AMP-binding protein, partial [Solirubrobacteraceae bacterium]